MKIIVIQGSARSEGNTHQIVQLLGKHLDFELEDLNMKNIHPYDYNYRFKDDDFLPLIRKVVEYDMIILASPVYWYSMSGLMKTFFDRLTDCLKIEKETGRKLKGKYLAAVACGSEPEPTEGFFIPFRLTAGYLGMNYAGHVHTWVVTDKAAPEVEEIVSTFAQKLKAFATLENS